MYNNEVVIDKPQSKERCANIRDDLKMCLLQTDCCRKYKKTPRQCLLDRDPSIPDECYVLKNVFYECKRSLIDARRRFRGPRDY
ncbi:cytochrome c oxidase assembly factor 5 [Chelonus insularis]|uniref:cytochrome c oxidase assembly factor 5 n=1 Tax=Chelonus insularis TaxID=460826 RepID=UPI00158C41F6|nr:cytochrome c oxidase assembly factor 5 [Chelonus insularis]